MIKNFLYGALVLSLVACEQAGSNKNITPSGYEYTHVSTGGQEVNEGDYVLISVKTMGDNGKVLNEIQEGPRLPVMQMPTEEQLSQGSNPVTEMLLDGGLGDSMTLIVPIDTLLKAGPNPAYDGMQYITYSTHIKKIMDETGYKAYMEELRLEQEKISEAQAARLDEVAAKVDQILEDYKADKLDVQETPEGLKYVILEEGDGPYGKPGRQAVVHYYGALMNGDRFDASFIKGEPFSFPVGQRRVIAGWDLGIPMMKEGSKAALFIPSELGYGKAGSPPRIPGDSDLMFYVELVEVI